MDVYRGKRVLLENGTLRPACVVVTKGKVVEVHEAFELPESVAKARSEGAPVNVVDAPDGWVIMAGLVDANVHTCEPGHANYESFAFISRAAAAGGITTVVDMPVVSKPATVSVEHLFAKIGQSRGKSYVDVGYWAGVTPDSVANVRSLVRAGVCGFRCHLYDSGLRRFPPLALDQVDTAMKELRKSDSVLAVDAHTHHHGQLAAAVGDGDPRKFATLGDACPESKEVDAVDKVLDVWRDNGAEVRLHFGNLASGRAVELIRAAQVEGLPVTAEVCVHHLVLDRDGVPDGATEFKTLPPVRDAANREMLWDAVREGVVTQVTSGHWPSTSALKGKDGHDPVHAGNFMRAAHGIASVQLFLPLMWTAAKDEGVSLGELHRLMSTNAAATAGLEHRKGLLAPGFDADIVIWDPKEKFVVARDDLLFRNKSLCPYVGRELYGVVKQTVVRGTTVFKDGKVATAVRPPGRNLLQGELGEEVGRFGEVTPGGPTITRRMSVAPSMISAISSFASQVSNGGEADGGGAPAFKAKVARRNSYFQ